VVKSWLTQAQCDIVDKHAPERIRLPSGFNAKIGYAEGQPPVLSATAQQLYGLDDVLKIGFGMIPVVVEVLAPNLRP